MNRLAVCPGSFDPVTLGHIDIITRAAGLFDKVIVLIMHNNQKTETFSIKERLDFLIRCTKNIENLSVDYSDGLLADYVKTVNAAAIVKGLRAVSDFDFEFQQALANKRMAPGVETIFITTKAENMFLSSSLVKQICSFGGDISGFVPAESMADIIKGLKKSQL